MSSQESDEETKTAERKSTETWEDLRQKCKELEERIEDAERQGTAGYLIPSKGALALVRELSKLTDQLGHIHKKIHGKRAMDGKMRALITKDKVKLNVGGTRFTTSVQTLTSVPNTFFTSMFSGRFDLTLNADDDGAHFIDRDGWRFRHILGYLRDPTGFELNADMTTAQRRELLEEAEFFCVAPLVTSLRQSLVRSDFEAGGHLCRYLLERACQSEDKEALKAAIAYARCVAFEIKSNSHFLYKQSRQLTFVMMNEFVNMSPVWTADVRCDFPRHKEEGTCFLCRKGENNGITVMTDAWDKNEEFNKTYLWNKQCRTATFGIPAPNLPTNYWLAPEGTAISGHHKANDGSQRMFGWEFVPSLCFRVIHALPDDDPTTVKALRKLAELSR